MNLLKIKSFPGQEKGEKAILVLRRHWFVFFKTILLFGLGLLIPIVIYNAFPELWGNIFQNEVIKAVSILLISAYYLGMWLFFFAHFVDYYLDIWIVSNKRIINTEQKGLFSRTISEQKLETIQDVTSEVKGIIPTFLDYGDVYIQSAGTLQRFVFKQVHHPNQIIKTILALVKEGQRFEAMNQLKTEIKIK